MPTPRCCATCKHPAIHYTPKGRISKDSGARCEYVITEDILKLIPTSVREHYSNPFKNGIKLPRNHMDPKEDRSDCPVYEEGQPKKQ